MRELTQTNLDPGNCWQTCIACLLDIDPEDLPAQVDYDIKTVNEDGFTEYGPSYSSVLQPYLRVHHNLAYVELHTPPETLFAIEVREPGLHMMTGRTIRTATNGVRHVVVGRYGTLLWDPHPSRAGLTDDIHWAFLVSFPESWRGTAIHGNPCICSKCS